MDKNVPHTLGDYIESAFWVFVYEALLYLGHLLEPVQLSQRMNYLFDENTRREDGSVSGGRHKVLMFLTQCKLNSSTVIVKFEKPSVNGPLNEIGNALHRRYPKDVGESCVILDDPDNPWFCRRLREAKNMEPYCITPTGLKSPANDSHSPDGQMIVQPGNLPSVIRKWTTA